MSHGRYNFKEIVPVPAVNDMIDIVLSRTQRKTATVVHPGYDISRIRNFYTTKVKYLQQTIHDKFGEILSQFPRLDDIHPFYSALCNVLYDRDHYKIALGQVNTVKNSVDTIAKDYVRLLKYADAPYKCKVLKRAAFGRMATNIKKLGPALTFLEEVRQHLGRLPAIDPNSKTLILTGYPNVGKSSFMNAVSSAGVDVQNFAFTTKSLFAGHFDFEYSRWQVIDTPGILDRPLDQRNTIEMTAITALAHLRAAVLFFIDPSGSSSYSIEEQVSLFHSIKPLFRNKPVLVVVNKTDLVDIRSLSKSEQELIQTMVTGENCHNVQLVASSTFKPGAIDEAKNKACKMLLKLILAEKSENSNRMDAIENRLFVTQPKISEERKAFIPDSVAEERATGVKKEYETEKDKQDKLGGAGVYFQNPRERWDLEDAEWAHDIQPEFMDGRNIAEFVDVDIDRKLAELEKMEQLESQWDQVQDAQEFDWKAAQEILEEVRRKVDYKRGESRMQRSIHGPARISRNLKSRLDGGEEEKKISGAKRSASSQGRIALEAGNAVLKSLESKILAAKNAPIGGTLTAVLEKQQKKRRASQAFAEHMEDDSKSDDVFDMDALSNRKRKAMAVKSRAESKSRIRELSNAAHRGKSKDRLEMSLGPEGSDARKRAASNQIQVNRRFQTERKKGEADRFIGTPMPKHLFSGKRTLGTANHR